MASAWLAVIMGKGGRLRREESENPGLFSQVWNTESSQEKEHGRCSATPEPGKVRADSLGKLGVTAAAGTCGQRTLLSPSLGGSTDTLNAERIRLPGSGFTATINCCSGGCCNDTCSRTLGQQVSFPREMVSFSEGAGGNPE